MKQPQYKEIQDVNFNNSYFFLSYIVTNTGHTVTSLSKILGIPKKRLMGINKFTRHDHIKVNELRKLVM